MDLLEILAILTLVVAVAQLSIQLYALLYSK